MQNDNPGFSTRAIHHGYDAQAHQGALVPPIYLSATFAFPTVEYGGRCFAGEEPGYFYTRISNPTLALLESRIASLEGGEAAVAFSSGMGPLPLLCGLCCDQATKSWPTVRCMAARSRS